MECHEQIVLTICVMFSGGANLSVEDSYMSIMIVWCNLYIMIHGEQNMQKWIVLVVKRRFVVSNCPDIATKMSNWQPRPPVDNQSDSFMHFLTVSCNWQVARGVVMTEFSSSEWHCDKLRHIYSKGLATYMKLMKKHVQYVMMRLSNVIGRYREV